MAREVKKILTKGVDKREKLELAAIIGEIKTVDIDPFKVEHCLEGYEEDTGEIDDLLQMPWEDVPPAAVTDRLVAKLEEKGYVVKVLCRAHRPEPCKCVEIDFEEAFASKCTFPMVDLIITLPPVSPEEEAAKVEEEEEAPKKKGKKRRKRV